MAPRPGVGVLVTGLSCGKPADSSVPSSPLRIYPCSSIQKEDPPLADGRHGGRSPGNGFSPRPNWLVSGQDAGLGRHRTGLRQSLPLVNYPTLEISGQVPSNPGLLTQETEALPATQRTSHFPLATLHSSSPAPAEAECPGRTWGPGAGAWGGQLFYGRWRGPGRAEPTPTEGFSPGDAGMNPASGG